MTHAGQRIVRLGRFAASLEILCGSIFVDDVDFGGADGDQIFGAPGDLAERFLAQAFADGDRGAAFVERVDPASPSRGPSAAGAATSSS
ncbi:MAG: hypothetical protein AAF763_04310 [Pseudomonadota bacterium]